ncbi:hypothetical protein TWF694_002893 [Orbilia ellipsospora]|uniref:Mid2 domain-containing protein n=1 Tax=Orbilia ellipsospora TaxID=2528407 RepID=A0AAV9X2J2_9PEZI
MRFVSAVSTLFISASLVSAQTNTINFSTVPVFNDLKKCLKAVFAYDYSVNDGPVYKVIGCTTNDCICRADTLQQAITSAGSMALSQCSNTNDKLSATSILSAYCTDNGFTEGNAVATPTDNSASSSAPSTSAGTGSSATPVTQTTSIVSTISGSKTTVWQTVTSIPTSESQTTNPAAPKKSIAGPVAGGVIGGIAAIAIIGGLVYWFTRKDRNTYSAAAPNSPPRYDNAYPNAPQVGGMDMESREVGGIQSYNDKTYNN